MNIETIIENNIKFAKMDGYIFTCPKCNRSAVRTLNKDQAKQLAGSHYLSCQGKPKGTQ